MKGMMANMVDYLGYPCVEEGMSSIFLCDLLSALQGGRNCIWSGKC